MSEHPNPADTDDYRIVKDLIAGFVEHPHNNTTIDWHKLWRYLSTAPPPLSDAERVDLILAAANHKKLTGEQWNQLVVGDCSTEDLDEKLKAEQWGDTGHLDPNPFQTVVLRSILEAFVNDGQLMYRKLMYDEIERVVCAPSCVLIVPSPFTSRAGERRQRVIASGRWGALLYGIWLLIDPHRPFLARLNYCRYQRCGKFYLVRTGKPGAPSRKYCCAAHGRAADTHNAAERMRQFRRKNQ